MLKNGQVSIEFFFLFMIVIAIFSVFFLFNTQAQLLASYITSQNEADSVAFRVGSAVNTAVGNPGLLIIANIPAHYEVYHQSGSIVATNTRTNISGSWPVLYAPVQLDVPANSTSINVSLAGGVITIKG
jgi:uncharacterized protein (UPF0333 family)